MYDITKEIKGYITFVVLIEFQYLINFFTLDYSTPVLVGHFLLYIK